ncbi:MAG: M48 family metallopeptidase [Clostridiales bacterium]|nr:M48 family metallopeptidase [Clostridiales bacterium]
MNWKPIVLIVATITSLYQMLLNYIQYRSAGNPVPANVSDIYDAATHKRWEEYHGEKSRLEIFSNLLSWVVTIVLLVLNAHAAVAKLFGPNPYLQLVVVVTFQTLLECLFAMITNYVDTMKIEQKYGFNRSSGKTFAIDMIRGLIIELVMGIVLAVLLCALHLWLGDGMVLVFAACVFGITLFISFIYPILSRMSNKFVPLEDGELKEKLTALLQKHGYHVKAIEVMDASRRTTKSNAYFTGFGKLKTIVLFDNLVNSMTPDEICAVFAHELGHGLNKDVPKLQLLNLLNMLLMAVLAWLTVRTAGMHTAFGFEAVNYGFAYILLGCAWLPLLNPLTGLLSSAYSRYAEYRADRQAVAEGYGQGLISGLKKLSKDNFSHLAPSPLLVKLTYSHPPLSQRIDAIEKAMAEQAK